MNIRPCVEIQENYNEISTLCKETQEPVFLTKDGSGEVLERRKKGMKGILAAQVIEHMRSAVQEAAHV